MLGAAQWAVESKCPVEGLRSLFDSTQYSVSTASQLYNNGLPQDSDLLEVNLLGFLDKRLHGFCRMSHQNDRLKCL